MPPKSSNKKSQVSWYSCEKCETNICFKDCELHDKQCPDTANYTFDFIKQGKLFTSLFTKLSFEIERLKDIPMKYARNIVFISEGAMKLCGFRIGRPVVIRSTKDEQSVPYVRIVWPIPEKFLTSAFVGGADFDQHFQQMKGPICLEALTVNPIPVMSVQLICTNQQDLDQTSSSEVISLIKEELKDTVFAVGSVICLDFFNKPLMFTVDQCNSIIENKPLESGLENLKLVETFYTTVYSTAITVKYESDDIKHNPRRMLAELHEIGGLNEQLKVIQEHMNIALGYKTIPNNAKVSRGMLLYGPTGCGKTLICESLVNSNDASVIRINCCQLYSKYLGETEKNLTQQFELAFCNYPKPTLVIIEDIHNLCPKYEATDLTKRVSISFFSILDKLNIREDARRIFVIATTNNIDNLNAGLRRCGRLDFEIEIPAPNPKARLQILQRYLTKVYHNLDNDFIEEIANITHGFVGSDISNLIYTSSVHALQANRDALEKDDITSTLNKIKPSAMREVLIENPNVKWTDIGGQEDLKLKLKQAIEWPLLYPEKFTRLGIKAPKGILMFGPPGCSKTMIAKALATESKVNFLSIKGPELFSMWVGESERAVRELFRKGRQVAPSIIFFDEIDAIGGERGSVGGGTSVKERVLTQLLTELDGINALKNVTIVAATNRPDMIDKALLRPGRIDRIVYVGLPDAATRKQIFEIKLKKMPVAEDVDIDKLVAQTDKYTGAEIEAVCREAALKVLEENFDAQFVTWKQFEIALNIVQPRTSQELLQLYDDYMNRI